jgi:hypothetical protein
MKSGGPEKAIGVCHNRTPEIAKEIGQKADWQIGRTSLKACNLSNIPDEVKRDVLSQF